MPMTTSKASEEQATKESSSHRYDRLWVDTGRRNSEGNKIYRNPTTKKVEAFPDEEE